MFFKPKIIREVNSSYSGKLKVVSTWGYKYIATGNLTQSGGLVKDVWEPVIKQLKNQQPHLTSFLILGLAGGTLADMISRKFNKSRITGVEIDPEMINLGKKYLNLGNIPGLKIIVDDAYKFVMNLDTEFDCILVDLYIGDRLPDFVYKKKFLTKLRKISTCVVFNHLFYNREKRYKAETLIESLKPVFPNIRLVRKLTNIMIICTV